MSGAQQSSSGTDTYGGPWWSYQTSSSSQRVVSHAFNYGGQRLRNYSVLVDQNKKTSLWCAFPMHSGAYPSNISRSESWKNDPGVDAGWQQSGVSGYSKGHMCASNYRLVNEASNKQTFFYTNQAPQYQNGFNDGVWNTMENDIKSHSPSSASDTLYVVVGVLYEGSAHYVSDIQIPSHFYACLMKCSFNGSHQVTEAAGCAYVFTNESHTGEKYPNFITSIDAMEQRTGFDFFANVPAALQAPAESSTTPLW